MNRQFDSVLEEFYQAWFRYHPEAAVDAGVPGYGHRLMPHGDDDIGALLSLLEMVLAALDEINAAELDPERRIDYRVLYGSALLEHHELMEEDWRHRDPVRFLPVQAIYQLLIRPVPDFGAALQERLAAIPHHLRSAQTHLAQAPEQVPPLWAEMAVIEAEQGAAFLRELPQEPRVARAFSMPGRVAGAAEAGAQALERFARFLEQEVSPCAAGDVACGAARFERILRYRHFLEGGRESLMAFARDLYARTEEELRAAVRALRGDEDVAAAVSAIQADHPSAEQLLSAYRSEMRAAYQFVKARDLVTVPAQQQLQLVETPRFLRHQIPFAAYMEPAPGDAEQRGYYFVTPPATEELLDEHNWPGLANTCVHEAWPGHHLQFVTANTRTASRSLPRVLNPSATLYEGWALYCEQLMHEQGFLDRPEQHVLLLRDRLWRALRVRLDIQLHTGGLDLEEAAGIMHQALGFPLAQARADVSWYTRAPGVPLGYAVGWALIVEARRRLQRRDEKFSLKRFHDGLLAAGSVGLPLGLEAAYGSEFARRVQETTFGRAV